MIDRKLVKNVDWYFVINILAILAMSILVLPSATATVTSDAYYFVRKQLLWIALGVVALGMVLSLDYNWLRRFTRFIYVANVVLLIAVLIIGKESNGAQSWIVLGPFQLQPSEFAKVSMIITFAHYLDVRQGKLHRVRNLIPCFAHFMIPMGLILLQPDLGTSLVFIAIMLGMMFVAGANPKLLVGIIALGLLVVTGALVAHFEFGVPLPLKDYQIMRLVVFLNPYNDGFGGRGAGYNIIQSLIAIGSGGLFGKGLFNGSQVQLNFLPEHHTDFIFSVVGEELGFVGAGFLLLLYFNLIYRSIRIASQAKDMFGTLLVMGVTSMIGFHVLENVGMTISMMPVTGLPLPLFSYGGSFMVANMIALGLILNVNIRRKKIVF